MAIKIDVQEGGGGSCCASTGRQNEWRGRVAVILYIALFIRLAFKLRRSVGLCGSYRKTGTFGALKNGGIIVPPWLH